MNVSKSSGSYVGLRKLKYATRFHPEIDNQFKRNFIFVIMPHHTHKCTNTLYDYAIIINTYVSLMCELKKIGKVFTSKCVGTGPSSYEKRIYRVAFSQRLRNTALDCRANGISHN